MGEQWNTWGKATAAADVPEVLPEWEPVGASLPAGPCSLEWGGDAAQWAQARNLCDLEIDLQLCGLLSAPHRQTVAEVADWHGLGKDYASRVRARYLAEPEAMRVLQARKRALDMNIESRGNPDVVNWLKRAAEAYKVEGNARYKKKEHAAALELYNLAIAAAPKNMILYTNKAAVLVETKAYGECVRLCEGLLANRHTMDASPQHLAKVHCRLGACFRRQGKFAEALASYDAARMEDPNAAVLSAINECKSALGGGP